MVNRYIMFRKRYGLDKPSMLWESIKEWSEMMKKGFLKELTLELQLCRLSRCWIGEGKIEVGRDVSGSGRGLRQSRNTRGNCDATKKWHLGRCWKIQGPGPQNEGDGPYAQFQSDRATESILSRGVTHPLALTQSPLWL